MSELPEDDSITREEMHHRRLDFRGYRRSDGQFEVRAHLTDRKPVDFTPPGDSRIVPAGAPVHDLGVTVVFDRSMVITRIGTFIASHPYRQCPGGGDTLQAMVGVSIGAGWNRAIRERLPSCDTCTHLREILPPLASAAYQTMTIERLHLVDARDRDGNPVKIDSCYAYGRNRELVAGLWPEHAKKPGTNQR